MPRQRCNDDLFRQSQEGLVKTAGDGDRPFCQSSDFVIEVFTRYRGTAGGCRRCGYGRHNLAAARRKVGNDMPIGRQFRRVVVGMIERDWPVAHKTMSRRYPACRQTEYFCRHQLVAM